MKKNKRQIIFELKRKSVHIILGAIIAFLIHYNLFFLPLWLAILFLGMIGAYLLKKEERIPLIHNFIVSFERKEEIKKTPLKGALLFLTGCILSYIIFEPSIAVVAIITLIVGDTVTALYGIYFGRIKSPVNPKKHIDATLVGVFVNTIFISILLPFPFWQIFLASLIALLAEVLLPFEKIEKGVLGVIFDDNIFVPLIAGLVLFFLNI
jgi:dolichol kinase